MVTAIRKKTIEQMLKSVTFTSSDKLWRRSDFFNIISAKDTLQGQNLSQRKFWLNDFNIVYKKDELVKT